MANLGTLWFGADIDLTALKQKINSGNQSILDALKMNYDPQSYQQMVSKLKTELGKEVFEIKINTNASAIKQNLQNTLSSINNSANAPKIDLSGLKGIPGMSRDILQMRDNIFMLTRSVATLKQQWMAASRAYGENSKQALYAKQQYMDANTALQTMRVNLSGLVRDRGLASIAQSEMNKQMREAGAAARQWNSDHMRLNATLAGGVHVSTQLGSALSSLFALDAARQFLGNVIEIGGQLEKQRISIGAILGDTVKATHLFEQIKGLALKSPFGVVELDQYTKQLSAYGFKYNELYDMTKRLADISAGAGTDIGRLTLALGHVRSATYLTGITLRQFSMNNIPMLKMLADYYSEVEKKAVSTAEVQKRISKRQVSYEDVIEQIRRLTDEGGMFYNMQEKISESLSARYKNLKDAMDIMYGEMAEGSVGDALKNLATILLQTTRHWREIATVMGVAFAAFMIGKTFIAVNTLAMQSNTAATLKQIMASKKLVANNLTAASTYRTLTAEERIQIASKNSLTAADLRQAMATQNLTKEDVLRLVALKRIKIAQAMHLAGINGITAAEIRAAAAAGKWRTTLAGLNMAIKNAFMGIGPGTWATLGIMVGTELYMAYDQWKDRIDSKSNEMKDLIKSRINDLRKMQKSIGADGKPTDSVELKNRVDEMKQVLANSEEYTKTLDEQLGKAGGLNEQYDILAKAIDKAADKGRKMLDVQDSVAEMIKSSRSDFSWVDLPSGLVHDNAALSRTLDYFFTEGIEDNMAQTLDAYKDLRSVIEGMWEYKDAIKGVMDEMIASGQISEQFAEQLKNSPFEEQIRLLAESGYWEQIVAKMNGVSPEFSNFAEKIKQASNGVTERWDEIANDDIPRMLKKEAERRKISEQDLNKWALDNIDDFKIMLDGIADQLDIKEPAIRKRLKMLFYDYVRFGELEKGLADGAKIGAILFSDENLKKLLGDDESANITDNTNNNSNTAKSEKKDKQLEAARTRLQEYKAFLQEYKKYREQYSKEKAIDLLKTLFPDLKDKDGNFLGERLVDDYIGVLDELRNSLKMTSEARKKFANDVDKTKADTMFDREKEALKRNADAMEEYVKRMEDQWKLYRSLFKKSGGNREFAELAFNESGKLWDEISKQMLKQFNKRGQELGVIPMNFHWDMNEKELREALVDAKGQVQEELVKLALEIQKIIRNNYSKSLEDGAEAYSKILTSTEKVLELEKELSDLEEERRNYNQDNPAWYKAQDTKIKAKKLEVEQAKRDAYKESSDYLNFYNAILSLTIPKAEKIGQKIRQNLNEELKKGKISAKQYLNEIKKIEEQLEKLRNSKSDLGALINGGLSGLFENMQEKGDSKWQRGINDLKQAEQDWSSARNNYYKAATEGNMAAKDQAQAQMQAAESSKQGANAMIKGGQAMSQGASSAMSTISTIDMIVHGINDAVQGINDAYNEIKEAAKTSGVDTNTESWSEWGTFLNSFSSASNSATNAWDSLKNGNIGGVISGVVGSFTGWITGISKGWDEKMDRQIEYAEKQLKATDRLREVMEKRLERTLGSIYEYKTSQDSIEKLREARDKTEEVDEHTYRERAEKGIHSLLLGAIGGVLDSLFGSGNDTYTVNYYNDDTRDMMEKAIESGTYYDEQLALLYKQRDELQHEYSAELNKKDSDNEKLEDFKNQIEDLQEEIDNFAQDMAKALYNIDVKEWASQLGDALFEAWQQGSNGAEAFRKKSKEILAELAKNIATTKLVEKALEPVLNAITEEMENKSGMLDEESVERIADQMALVGQTMPDAFNALMDGIDAGVQRSGLGSLKDLDSSSSVGSSIKGITENTADLLASYINAIRADVSVDRNMIATYYPQFLTVITQVSVLSQTQVTLQQQIASNTLRNADAADRIYDILHRVSPDGTSIRVK